MASDLGVFKLKQDSGFVPGSVREISLQKPKAKYHARNIEHHYARNTTNYTKIGRYSKRLRVNHYDFMALYSMWRIF